MNKIIYSLKVMTALVEEGFIPIATMDNPKYPQYKCWVFKVTDDFTEILNKILGGMKDDSQL